MNIYTHEEKEAIDFYNKLPPNIMICFGARCVHKDSIVGEIVSQSQLGSFFVKKYLEFKKAEELYGREHRTQES